MAVSAPRWVRWALFLGALAALVAIGLLRDAGPAAPLVALEGPREVHLTLAELRALPALEREGSFQNTFGNWSRPATYRGTRLTKLVGAYFPALELGSVIVVARDGYRLEIPAWRVEDDAFPMVLAYARDGAFPPDWADGPQIAVLPEGGRVGNEAYGVESAGAYWVRDVERLILVPRAGLP